MENDPSKLSPKDKLEINAWQKRTKEITDLELNSMRMRSHLKKRNAKDRRRTKLRNALNRLRIRRR